MSLNPKKNCWKNRNGYYKANVRDKTSKKSNNSYLDLLQQIYHLRLRHLQWWHWDQKCSSTPLYPGRLNLPSGAFWKKRVTTQCVLRNKYHNCRLERHQRLVLFKSNNYAYERNWFVWPVYPINIILSKKYREILSTDVFIKVILV